MLKKACRYKQPSVLGLFISNEMKRSVLNMTPGANIIKHFTMVIYCHSMVILSFSVIKLYHLGNYYGIAVTYNSI